MKKNFLCKMLLLMAVLLGFGFNAKAQVTFDYMPVSVTPANNSTLASLKQIEIATDAFWANLNISSDKNVVNVYDQNGNVVTSGSLAFSPAVTSNIVCPFEEEITATGVYTVVVPQNLFGDDNYFYGGFNAGRANPELTYTYTIGEDVVEIKGLPTSVDPADGSEISSLTTIKLLFSASDYPNALRKYSTPAELYNSSNKKIAEGTLDYTQGTNYYGITVTFDKIAEADTYTVLIKEGTIYEDGNTANKCPEIKLTYIVTGEEPEPDYSQYFVPVGVYPAEGTVLEGFSNMFVVFSLTDLYPVDKEDEQAAEVYDANNNLVSYCTYSRTLQANGVNFEFTLTTPVTKSGEYTVVIPEGKIYIHPYTEIVNPELRFTYTVVAPEPDYSQYFIPVSVYPAEGEILEQLQGVMLEFSTDQLYPNGFDNGAKVYDANGNEVAKCSKFQQPGGSYGYRYCIFTLDTPVTKSGEYTVVIPEGKLYINGHEEIVNPEYRFTYTVVSPYPISITPADGETVEELSTIYLKFDANVYPGSMEYDYEQKAEVYNEAGELVALGGYGYADAPVYMTISIALNEPIKASGTYTVKVGEGHIYEYGKKDHICPAFEVNYVVEGSGVKFTCSPNNEEVQKELSAINIYLSDYSDMYIFQGSAAKAEIYKDGSFFQEISYIATIDGGISVPNLNIKESGVYTFKFPEGSLDLYDKDYASQGNVPAFEVNYVVEGSGVKFTCSPNNKEVQKELSAINIYLSDYSDMYIFQGFAAKAEIYKDGSFFQEISYIATINGGISVPNLNIKESGVYTFKFPEGSLDLYDSNYVPQGYVPAFEVTYTVESPYRSLPISITPADGETVEELSTIYLEFDANDYPGTMNYDYNQKAKVYNEAGEIVSEGGYGYGVNFWIVTINLTNPIKTAGNYRIEIGENHINEYKYDPAVEGRDPYICPAFSINYTVVPAKEIYGYIYVNDQMDKGVLTLAAEGLEFAEEEIGSWNQEDLMTRSEAVTFNKRFAYSIVGELQASYDITYTWADGTVKESTFVLEGDMTDGYISFEGDSITGIEGIDAENGEVEYYNMQGVRVENPENGLYIRRQGNKTEKVYIRK